MMSSDNQLSRHIYDLCVLLLAIFRTPIPTSSPPPLPPSHRRAARPLQQVSPAGFASLLLGASLALMLCGSVTLILGFILMPWVIGLVMLFYFAGIVSNLSGIGRAMLYDAAPSGVAGTSPKETTGPGPLQASGCLDMKWQLS